MRIGILGDPSDVQVQAVAEAISSEGASVVQLPPSAIELGGGVALLDGDLFVDEHAFDDVGAWWVKQLPYSFVPTPRGDRVQAISHEGLHELQVQVRERLMLTLSWLLELEDLGIPIINSPRSGMHFIPKPYQLERMRRAGVPVPRTLYTSSPEAAVAFRNEVGPCIVKPIAGGATTRDFDDEDVRASLESIRGAPIVVQERAYGQHLRVTIVGGEIVSAVVIRSDALDYRTDPNYHTNASYEEAGLSEAGRSIALLAAEASALVYTGIDILRDGDRHTVLECNTSPIYLDIERRMGHPISRKLAQYLIARAESAEARVALATRH